MGSYSPECVWFHDADQDGDVDADDEDHFAESTWQTGQPDVEVPPWWRKPEQPKFDAAQPGSFDLQDYMQFTMCVGQTGVPTTDDFCRMLFDGDYNKDVDEFDYALWATRFTNPADQYELPSQSRFGNPFMWTGQRFDSDVGLYHFLYRSYSPEMGRWMQRDKLGVLKANPMGAGIDGAAGPFPRTLSILQAHEYRDGLSLSLMVGANPISSKDPLGLSLVGTASSVTIGSITQGAMWGAAAGAFGGAVGGAIGGALDPRITWYEGLAFGAFGGAIAGATGGAFLASGLGIWSTMLLAGGLPGAIEGFITEYLASGDIWDAVYWGAIPGFGIGTLTMGIGHRFGLGAANDVLRHTPANVGGLANTALRETVQHIPDDALVHFSADVIGEVAPNFGKSFWYRWGDIKHLTPRQVEGAIGGLAQSGQPGGARVMSILTEVPASVGQIPASQTATGIAEYTLDAAVTPQAQAIVQ